MAKRVDSLEVRVIKPKRKKLKENKQLVKERPVIKDNVASRSTKKEKRGNSLMVFIIIVAIIGVGLFFMQYGSSKKNSNKIDKVKISLENELINIKSEIDKIESEKTELESENENLLDNLTNAEKEFYNLSLGLKFKYPAIFGEVNLKVKDVDSGKAFIGEFSNNDKLTFGGISKEFNKSEPGNFLETQGYRKRQEKYYFKYTGEEPELYEITPIKILELENNIILIVNKDSFALEEETESPTLTLEKDSLGALINLSNENFKGLAFLNKDVENFPLEDFEEMLSTIVVE
ncbi:MAG: hypothetical protein ABIE43_05350 [Patescibacteria group bacterium]